MWAHAKANIHTRRGGSHHHTNRADDSYRTEAHRAHEREDRSNHAPEKPCPILWPPLSREHHGLAHLSVQGTHGGDTRRRSIALFEAYAPSRPPTASACIPAIK